MHVELLSYMVLLAASTAQATVAFPRSTENGQCTGKGGAPGVCISTSSCSSGGGSYISNACPGTPDNIKCCVKTECGPSGRNGDCRFTNQCGAGKTTLSNLCPGPTNFKCCVDAEGGGGGSTGNLGEQVLKKAQEAEGTPCKF